MKHESIGGKFLNKAGTTMTGREAEEGFLGAVDNANKKYRSSLLRRGIPEGLLRNMSETELPYITFRDAIEMVKDAQPWNDPANPEKDFLRELRIEVAGCLGIGNDEDKLDRLRIYTAVGSPLDLVHSVDFFIEYEKKEGVILRVFFDLTNDPAHKKEKQDIMIVDANAIGDPADDEKKYEKFIEALAAKIARKLGMSELKSNKDFMATMV